MPQNNLSCKRTRDRRDIWNAELLEGCQYDGKYEMPILTAYNTVPSKLTSFSDARIETADGSFVHFYMDDYKYDGSIWRNPRKNLPLLKAYGGAISPDFSVYREMPLAEQINSVYRSRVLSYWWARNGIPVIPSVRWGDARTYEFCFDGLPKHSVVAVGTHGCVKRTGDRQYFFDGFMELLRRIEPEAVIVYGAMNDLIFPPLFIWNVNIVHFISDFSRSCIKRAV